MFRPIHCKPVCYFDVKSSFFFLDICVQGKGMDDGYTLITLYSTGIPETVKDAICDFSDDICLYTFITFFTSSSIWK
jgi:hypothetical protein